MKQRQSNIELLRLVAMFLIVVTHTNLFSLGRPKIDVFHTEPVWVSFRFALQSFTYIGVNLFILISGYFSIRPHLRSVVAFLFQILFLSLGIVAVLALYGVVTGDSIIGWKQVSNALLSITRFNWFIPSYLMLMLFAPLINAFCQQTSKTSLGLFILFLFLASSYLGWGTHCCKEFNDGYSFVSLVLLYTVGRYLRLHNSGWVNRSAKIDAMHFLLYVLVNTVIALWRMKNPYKMSLFALNNPIQLYGAVCFFLFFTKLQFQHAGVNVLAKGTFGIFLLQMHPQVIPLFRKSIQYLNQHLDHLSFTGAALGVALLFCVAGILCDIPRQWVWKKLDPWVCRCSDKAEQFLFHRERER